MKYEVDVVFSIEAASSLHAKEVIKNYLRGKGVLAAGEEELADGRKEERYGYEEIKDGVETELC
jgi:hypothetical protein